VSLVVQREPASSPFAVAKFCALWSSSFGSARERPNKREAKPVDDATKQYSSVGLDDRCRSADEIALKNGAREATHAGDLPWMQPSAASSWGNIGGHDARRSLEHEAITLQLFQRDTS
jgi:hypothetical protein